MQFFKKYFLFGFGLVWGVFFAILNILNAGRDLGRSSAAPPQATGPLPAGGGVLHATGAARPFGSGRTCVPVHSAPVTSEVP